MIGTLAVSRHEAAAALGWLVDAGVDSIVGETPFAWLAPAGPVAPSAVEAPVTARETVVAKAAIADARGAAINADSLTALAAALIEAHPTALFADGMPGAAMVIGDRPTAADAAVGRIFSDAPGSLLDRMLAAIGLSHDTAYLANAVAWPLDGGEAGGRAPSAAEIAAAAPYLRRQIVLAKPRAVLALGQVAASALTGSSDGINRLRGRWHEVDIDGVTVVVMPTFHPAYLLMNPRHKALAWVDLQAFRARLAG